MTLSVQKITFDTSVTDLVTLRNNKISSLMLAESYKDLRENIEDHLGRICKSLVKEVFDQAWSPCMYEIKLELLSYRSFVSDGLSRMLFERIKDQRMYDGYYNHFDRKLTRLESKANTK